MPYLNITSHVEGRKDDNLLAEKGGRGFPYIVFMDDAGNVLAKQPDTERTVEGFRKTLAGSVQRFLDLRAKAQAGDAAAQIEFALLEGDMGTIPFEEVQKRLEGKKLSDAQKAQLGELEMGAMIAAVGKAEGEDASRAAMKKVADAYAAGRMPAAKERQYEFLNILLTYGMAEEDPDLAQKALDALKPVLREMMGTGNKRLEDQISALEDKIADLRAAKEGGKGGDEGIEEGCGEGAK